MKILSKYQNIEATIAIKWKRLKVDQSNSALSEISTLRWRIS